MPVKDGITALYEIKGQPLIKVIMMTAYEERNTVTRVKKAVQRVFFKTFRY